jgi:hypothetical protein
MSKIVQKQGLTDLTLSVIPTAHIDGFQVRFSEVWVHLKGKVPVQAKQISINVPLAQAEAIFDKGHLKSNRASWPEFIRGEIATYGTLIVEFYFKNLSALAGETRSAKRWVLINVRAVESNDEFISMQGIVEEFGVAKPSTRVTTREGLSRDWR